MIKLVQKDSKQDVHSQVNNRKSFPKENNGPLEVLELKESKRLKVEDGVCSSFLHSEARENLSIGFGLEINGDVSSKGHHNGTVTKIQVTISLIIWISNNEVLIRLCE